MSGIYGAYANILFDTLFTEECQDLIGEVQEIVKVNEITDAEIDQWNTLFLKFKDRFDQDRMFTLKRVQGAMLRRFKREGHLYSVGDFSSNCSTFPLALYKPLTKEIFND